MTQHIQFGSKKIVFQLSFANRKTLGITVTPDLEVLVKAPLNSPLEKIKESVRKKAPWILKQENYFLGFYPKTPPKKYVGGETHLYLGRQYQLKVRIGKKPDAKYKGRILEIVAKNKKDVKQLLNQWYRHKAKEKFAEIAEPHIQRFKKYNVEPSGLFIQNMKTRWGSCTPQNKIILNVELIKAPKQCIEYVIIHELCHLVHYDHTQKFIALQSKEMPDWEKWKNKLERLLA